MLAFLVTVMGMLIGEARLASITSKSAAVWGVSLLTIFGFARFNIGTYTSARNYTSQGLSNLERILSLWGRLQDMAIGLDRIFDLLDLEPEVQDAIDAIDMPPLNKSITYENVRFVDVRKACRGP